MFFRSCYCCLSDCSSCDSFNSFLYLGRRSRTKTVSRTEGSCFERSKTPSSSLRNQPRPRKHRGKIHATRAVSVRGSFRKIVSRLRPKTPRETNNEIYEESNQVPMNTFSSHMTLGNPAYIFGEPPKQGLQNMRTPTPIQVSPSPAPPSSHYVVEDESTQPYYHDVEDHKDSSDDTHSNATVYETLSKYDQKQLRYPNHVATMPLAGANASPVVESIKYASMNSRPSLDGSIASSGHSENALLPSNAARGTNVSNPLFKIEIGSQENEEGRNLTGYEQCIDHRKIA